MFFCVQSAAGQQDIGGTYACNIAKLHADIVFIHSFQSASCQLVHDLAVIIVPIIFSQLCRNIFKLVGKTVVTGNAKPLLKSFCDNLTVFFLVLPENQIAGIVFCTSVRHIKNILDTRIPVIDMDEGNALRATTHITAHFLRPDVKTCHCGGLRILGVD